MGVLNIKKIDDNGSANLVPVVLAVVIVFAMIFIGAYVNGEINQALTDTYEDNTASGSVSSNYWHNWTTTSTYRNITMPTYCTVGSLDGTSKWYIQNNNTQPVLYNLTVNGNVVNDTSTLAAGKGWNVTIAALITAGNLTAGDTYINYTWDVNASTTAINIITTGTYYKPSDYRNPLQNTTYNTMFNISGNWDSALDIVQVVIIITLLAIAVGAIFLFTKFR